MSDVQDDQLEVNGNVHFRMNGNGPRWPQQCVVCGDTCVETREVFSTRDVYFGRFSYTIKGLNSFLVPVHVTAKGCERLLRHPIPLWAQIAWMLAGLAVGVFMGAIAKPDWGSRGGAFLIFGGIGLIIARVPVIVMFESPLDIKEIDGPEFFASFKDESYALRFAELNQADVIAPWKRPAWDISINLFPKRKNKKGVKAL